MTEKSKKDPVSSAWDDLEQKSNDIDLSGKATNIDKKTSKFTW